MGLRRLAIVDLVLEVEVRILSGHRALRLCVDFCLHRHRVLDHLVQILVQVVQVVKRALRFLLQLLLVVRQRPLDKLVLFVLSEESHGHLNDLVADRKINSGLVAELLEDGL